MVKKKTGLTRQEAGRLGGRPKSPDGPMPRVGVKLPAPLLALLDARCEREGLDRTAVIRLALTRFLTD